jgi:hypothetical protein
MMREMLAVFIITTGTVPIVSAPARSAGAQTCKGDFNGDGRVTVDEIITTVLSALNGCVVQLTPTPTQPPTRTPTPTQPPVTGCTLRFDQDYGGGRVCFFTGDINSTCGGDSLTMSFTTLGFLGVFLVLAPPGADCTAGGCFTFLATPTGPTSANLTHWSNDPFNPYFQHVLSGNVSLSPDGERLDIDPDSSPFAVNGCPFVEFDGTYHR